MTLEEAIRRGFPGAAARLAREALQTEEGLSLVETRLIPALDRVGLDYEQGIAFLPQLMGAAQAAQAVFQEVAAQLEKQGGAPVKKGPVILATVRGDIHDIGKNIVKTLMENYGFRVIDLGRDVPVETVVEAARKHQAPLVGLSALMTTTLPPWNRPSPPSRHGNAPGGAGGGRGGDAGARPPYGGGLLRQGRPPVGGDRPQGLG